MDDVSVVHPSTIAVDDVSLHVAAGEALALVGPSGSGKTTLLRVLNGTIRPTEGCIVAHGKHLGRLSREELRRTRSTIGFVPQDLGLVPNLRVLQNVLAGRLGSLSFGGTLRALLKPKHEDVDRAHALLERVGIPEKLYERTDRLSGGQQQRVAIARALFQSPSVLLADEPVSSVDPARAKDTVRLLTELSREDGLTLVVSLHDLNLARAFFPRLVGLRAGRVVFDAPTGDIPDATFHELYELDRGELLADGA